MEGYLTTKEAAELWNTSAFWVRSLCETKDIPAVNRAKRWFIPTDTPKPADLPDLSGNQRCLPIGAGSTDYKAFSSRLYYVDKTLLLRDIIDLETGCFLFTRPRRFGKSLNMDMIRTFFERTEEDNSAYFVDKKIWACDEAYRLQQGRYPVIYLNLKDAEGTTWEDVFEGICDCLANEAERHPELEQSDKCYVRQKGRLARLLDGEATEGDYADSLRLLAEMLHSHYDSKIIVMIDEYDVPIRNGYLNGFYTEVISFLRRLLGPVLKDNNFVRYSFLTGILQMAKESIFSGLNNINVYSVLDPEFSTYFGFTEDEVHEMAVAYHAEDKMDEIREWYRGYVFGGTEIYNPWSVANYFEDDCTADAYWANTSGNDLIGELISVSPPDILTELQTLMNGQTVDAAVDVQIVYPDISNNPYSIFSFLLATGYLTAINDPPAEDGKSCTLAIPNLEVLGVFREEILKRFSPKQQAIAGIILTALKKNDWEKVKESLQKFLFQSASYFDTAVEGAYHAFMLGVCTVFAGYYVTSNRESGDGRYDVEIAPKRTDQPGILLEFKALKKDLFTDAKLHDEAVEALHQINKNHYDENLKMHGIRTIYKYGMAFSGKHVDVVSETLKLD